MANNQISGLLESANMQMAAEAFLIRANELVVDPDQVVQRLTDGNNRASRFTPIQAEQFNTQYKVLAQYRNDPEKSGGTGFSATLIKKRGAEEYTLSIRSTEFMDDAVRDNLTGQLEINELGWALGQIAELEAWYAQLRADPEFLAGKTFNVTGYSLGGHLATVFNILRREEAVATGTANPIIHTYTFNGAGTGSIKNGRRLTDLINDFNRIKANHTDSTEWRALNAEEQQALMSRAQSRVDAVTSERNRVAGLGGIGNSLFPNVTAPLGEQADLGYQVAALLVGEHTTGASPNLQAGGPLGVGSILVPVPGGQGFDNMTEIVGMEREGAATSFVSNSGFHYGSRLEVPIEGQPYYRGNFVMQTITNSITNGSVKLLGNDPAINDFGDTHSLVLLIDSLSLMAAMEKLAPELTLDGARLIFDAISNAAVQTESGTQGMAEGDSLERTLEAFRKLLLPDAGEAFTEDNLKRLLAGNTWHAQEFRGPFHEKLKTLQDKIASLTGASEQPFAVDELVTKNAAAIQMLADTDEASGFAYRYALKQLDPFAVIENNSNLLIYNNIISTGTLDRYNAANHTGTVTAAYLGDRAQLLNRKTYYNANNARYDKSDGQVDPNDASATDYDPEDIVWIDVASRLTIKRGSETGATRYRVFGNDDSNVVRGDVHTDSIYGGGGVDYVIGKGGDDYLEGGTGLDIYEYDAARKSGLLSLTTSPDGHDTILDVDGKGIWRYQYVDAQGNAQSTVLAGVAVKEPGGKWKTPDGRFVLEQIGANLKVTFGAGVDGGVTLRDFDFTKAAQGGYFGIRLIETRALPVTVSPIIVGDYDYKENPADPNVYLYDVFGNPLMGDGPGGEVLNNALQDTPENDRIEGLLASDWLVARRGGSNHILGGDERDYIEGGAGNDVIEGGADGNRGHLGGGNFSFDVPGGDDLLGAAGDDRIYGNVYKPTADLIHDGATGPTGTNRGDVLIGGDGNDLLAGDVNGDLLAGGSGDDLLIGGAADDFLLGDADMTFAGGLLDLSDPQTSRYWNWTINSTINAASRQDFYAGFLQLDSNPNDAKFEDAASPGQDMVYGGAGNDVVYAGGNDDVVWGESGEDWLFGEGGSDVLIGGTENDVLSGDSESTSLAQQGDDYLDGGDGGDRLFGYGGNDILIGGTGNDQLQGGDGNDILMGGPGDEDILIGGSGKDTYVFNRGDGTEIIVDTAGDAKSPDASVVVLGDGISRSDIKFRKGSLMVDLGPSNPDDPLAGNDQIHFTDFNGDHPETTVAIGEIRFADGTSMDYADILAQGFDIDGTAFDDAGGTALIGTSVTDRMRGFAGSDELEGRDGNDVLTGDGGADRLDAGNGNDMLDGGAGGDFLAGGMGSDDYHFIRGDGTDTLIEGSLFVPGLSDPAGTDRIVFGGDITRGDVSLFRSADGNLTVRYGAGDEIRIEGQYGVTGSDIESITFADGQIIAKAELDALEAGVVQGTANADELSGTAGNDVLNGGAGSDTYALYWGMGNDRIIDAADGQTNMLALLGGATLESIKTSRDGDDLRVTIRGGGGSATVQGFFTDGSAPAWQIASAMEGSQSLLDFHVAQSTAGNAPVIDAMQDYQQQLLGEWRAQGQSNFDLPTQVYVHSTWSQTISSWTTLVPAFPEPVIQVVTHVNDPTTHTTVQGFGIQQGGRVIELPQFDGAVVQRIVDPHVEEIESDDSFISTQSGDDATSDFLEYTFNAGGGGPFSNSRTYSYSNGFVTNTVTESSTEGWIPLTLREDGLGQYSLTIQQLTEIPVIEQITAGASSNTIFGAEESEGNHVALIDAGAGDDVIWAGQYDFAFGNDGDDEINGGTHAFGGNGYDSLLGGRFMSGGADDDYLSGGEGRTIFRFHSDEAGWDWVEDQNGISLNEFAIEAGIVDSYSNLVYGGKYRYLNSDFALTDAFSDWALRNPDWHGFATGSLGDEQWPVPNSVGFPRGVPDEFARELAPAWGDGYYTWVYNSVDDMMRDFADLGLHFNPDEVRQVPGVPEMSDFTADNYRALEPFFESGVLEKDTVELADFQAGVDELKIGFVSPEYGDVNRVLRLLWGEDKVIDIELPSATDLIGHGIEEVRYGGDTVYIGDFVDSALEEGFLGTPFDDSLSGTAENDRIRGLGGQDLIEGGTGDDVLSGGTGGDMYFFNAGDGADTVIDAVESGQINRMVLRDYLASDISGFRDGAYVVLEANGTGDAVRILWDEATAAGVDLVEFADGTTWDRVFLDQLAGSAVNSPPVVAAPIGAISTTEDAALDFVIPANTFQDADTGDVLTYTATLAGGGALPSWLSFDAGTRTFSGTPLEADVGTISVRVTATDASDAAVSDVFNLTVLNTNDAPVLSTALADQNAVEDQAFSFAIPVDSYTDEDAGDQLVYTATLGTGAALPEWLVFDDATNTFSGVPTNEDTGTLSIRVTATDGDGVSVSDTFAITVSGVNDAPELSNPLTDQAVTAGTLFNYVVPVTTFVDIDAGDSVTLSARLAGGAALPSWLAFDAASGTFSGTFNGIPSASNVGVLDVEVVATDASGTAANDQFVLTVNPAAGLTLTGTAAVDTLTGGYGNDVIDGLAGADQMSGGDGDDSYIVDHVNDAVLENPTQGHDTVLSSVTHTLATEVEDLVLTGTANRNGTGNDLANTITGNAGANRLDGGIGADSLIGGSGNDTYIIDNTLDTVFEASGAGTDTVQSSVNSVLSANVENLLLTGEAAIDGTGNELANVITGNAAANTLIGGAGNDRLSGGAGVDTLIGGIGNDTYLVDLIDEFIIEQANEGTDTVHSPFAFTLADHFENLTLTGDAASGTGNAVANRLTGNALANVLSGLDGNDILDGKAGADTLIGGIGNDTYIIDDSADVTAEFAGEGTDTVQAAVSYVIGAEIERLTLTGSTEISGTGNALDNRLTGNAAINTLAGLEGNDTLDGKAGADTLIGGAGNDSYVVDNSDDAIIELADEGIDAVTSSAAYTLAAYIENLTLSGTAALDGTGNDLGNRLTGNIAANVLTGLSGNDMLDGKAGADTLIGGAGDDLYIIDNAGDVASEVFNEGTDTVQTALAWTLDGNVENLTLAGVTAVNGIGNSLDNVLTGNNAANVLTGLAGNDTLDGKGGIDTLIGGAGDDTYVVNHANDVITELAGEGTDTVRSSTTRTLDAELEHLILTGAGSISATGNVLDNVITGNAGNNTLDGATGADVMAGGLGNDTYMVDDSGDAVIEAADSGVDTVKTGMAYTLTANVENLTLTGTAAVAAMGNELANILIGNNAANTLSGLDGNDVLDGRAGADAMTGGTGDDVYTVDNAGDTVTEISGEGTDTVRSSLTYTLGDHAENLVLTGNASRNGTGNALDNILTGNNGANTLNGLAGDDALAGGLGGDTYRFDLNFGHDVIVEDDATAGNLDKIVFGTGIAAADITLGRLNDDLVAHTADQQHSIQMLNWFTADANKVERIEFADGTIWDQAAINATAMRTVDMPGLLRGGDQVSTLLGQIGNTVLEGADGDDVLTDLDGSNIFAGGDGDDAATGGAGNDLFIGGAGNDTLTTGAGNNVIAYNAGGGVDTVHADAGADNTLSLGGGLGYSDLSLSRNDNDLVLNTGVDDRIIFKDWYVGQNSLLNLQLILDATDEFDANSTDPLFNRRVQNFDFLGMVNGFDVAQAANPGLTRWALSDALMQYHLSGSDDAALGGDLAYWYARNDGLTGISLSAAQGVIGASGFGAEAQSLRPFSGLQEGLVRLG